MNKTKRTDNGSLPRQTFAPPRRLLRKTKFATLSLASLFIGSSAIGQDEGEDDADVFELSPFEVSAESDRGYEAQNTLSGTRLNTSTKDVGVTMSILTEQFMEDLALTSTEAMMDFTPGSEKAVNQGSTGIAGQVYWGENLMIRGVRVDSTVRNQFASKITGDSYNAGRFEFSRGGNSILFGIGNPAGLVNRYTNDATFSDTNRYRFQINGEGGTRHELNLNRVLIKDKLAARVAIMHEEDEDWLKPLFKDQDRAYLALNYKPLENLTFKFRAESFDSARSTSGGGIHDDAVSVYDDAATAAGESWAEHAIVHDQATTPVGDEFLGYSGGDTLAFVNDASGAQVQNWRNKATSAERRTIGNNRANLPVDFLPRDWNIFGNSNFQDFSGFNLQAVAQWKVNDKLDIELAVNKEEVTHDFYINWSADVLRIDANSTLSDGVTPNPNAGQYFVRNDTSWRKEVDHELNNARLTVSYEFDFAEESDNLGWLGKHNVALLMESAQSIWMEDSLFLANTNTQGTGLESPGGGFAEAPRNGWNGSNIIKIINYIDVDTQTIYGPTDPREYQAYANQFPGITAEWVPAFNSIRGQVKDETIDSFLGVIQSRFLDNRLVTTFGWREDEFDILGGNIVQDPTKPAGWATLAEDVPLEFDEVASEPTPDTISRGINFHAIRNGDALSYLTLYGAESTTFSNNANGETPLRNPLASMTGLTRNYGIKFGLMQNKLTGSFTVFDVTLENQPSNDFGKWAELDLLGQAHGITMWEGINPSNTRDTRDLKSEGWEMQVTANITNNWRMMLSFDHYETKFSNVAPVFGEIFDDYTDVFLSDPELMVRGGDSGVEGEPLTAQEAYDTILIEYLEFKAQEGRRTMNERSNKFVLVTAYDIHEGAFKGLGFGADVIWQDKALTGFASKQLEDGGTFVPDPDNPFFGEDLTRLGAHIKYGRKILNDKVDWKIQLNIHNIGGVDPYVVRHSAEDAAPTTPVAWYTNRGLPTQYTLSNTFKW